MCRNENMKGHFDGNKLGMKYDTNFNNMIPRQFMGALKTMGVSIRKILKSSSVKSRGFLMFSC